MYACMDLKLSKNLQSVEFPMCECAPKALMFGLLLCAFYIRRLYISGSYQSVINGSDF